MTWLIVIGLFVILLAATAIKLWWLLAILVVGTALRSRRCKAVVVKLMVRR